MRNILWQKNIQKIVLIAGLTILFSAGPSVKAAGEPGLSEVGNALTNLPNNAAWQGVANDGIYFYLLTSQNTSTNIQSGKENIIRKYRISDGQLINTKNNAYTNTRTFSSGEVIDGKLYVAVRDASVTSTWAHIVIYNTDNLNQLEDRDIRTSGGYAVPEGVAKKHGYFWVVFAGFGGGSGNVRMSAVVRYDPGWKEVAAYNLVEVPSGNHIGRFGAQDILWINDTEIITNIHEGSLPEENRLDLWKWTGSGFIRIKRFQQLPDDSSYTIGQGFTWLNDHLYFAARFSDRLVKATLNVGTLDTDGDGCYDGIESQTATGSEVTGGLRNPDNPWDFYDTNGDRVIDLPNDIHGVIQHYAPNGYPPGQGYEKYDRGPSTGPYPWSMTAPDGVIDLSNDIYGVLRQYGHKCQ